MNHDPASLDHLHDIIAPPPVPLWPPAPGWDVVAALVLLLVVALVLDAVRRWRANAYRRAALAELRRITSNDARGAVRTAELLKRTALAAFPRETVAGLSGTRWLDWLDRTGGFAAPGDVRRILEHDLYRPDRASDTFVLQAYAETWIRKHERRALAVGSLLAPTSPTRSAQGPTLQ